MSKIHENIPVEAKDYGITLDYGIDVAYGR